MTDNDRETMIKQEGRALAIAFGLGDSCGAKHHNTTLRDLIAGRSSEQIAKMEQVLQEKVFKKV